MGRMRYMENCLVDMTNHTLKGNFLEKMVPTVGLQGQNEGQGNVVGSI